MAGHGYRELEAQPVISSSHDGPELAGASATPSASMFASAVGQLGGSLLQRKIARRRAQRGASDQGGAAGTPGEAAILAAGETGTSGPGGALPHADVIQRAFGRHDVSGVTAHLDANASQAARSMGAEAFASGDHVAFDGAPSLHTAAHEAAHVVQQRAGVQLLGGVGEEGDAYERHADQVADLVVQGRPAEHALDQMSGGGGASSAVQRKRVPVKERIEDYEKKTETNKEKPKPSGGDNKRKKWSKNDDGRWTTDPEVVDTKTDPEFVDTDEHGKSLNPEKLEKDSGLKVKIATFKVGAKTAVVSAPVGDRVEGLVDPEQLGDAYDNDKQEEAEAHKPPPLGRGGNGVVHEATSKKDGKPIVVKRLYFTFLDDQKTIVNWLSLNSLVKEALLGQAFQQLPDPGVNFVVKFVGAGMIKTKLPQKPMEPWMVTEIARLEEGDDEQKKDAEEYRKGYARMAKDVDEPVAIFEKADGGDLMKKLMGPEGAMTPQQALKALSQLASAVGMLAKYGMTHHDIAPKNLLLHGGNLLLGDMGEVIDRNDLGEQERKVPEGKEYLKKGMGLEQTAGGTTTTYPRGGYGTKDQEKTETHSVKTDVWSMGLITIDLLLGLFGNNIKEAADRYSAFKKQEDVNAEIEEDFEKKIGPRWGLGNQSIKQLALIKDLVMRMLVLDPDQRCTADAITAILDQQKNLFNGIVEQGNRNQ